MATIDSVAITWIATRALPSQLGAQGATGFGRLPGYMTQFAAGDTTAGWQRPWTGDVTYSYFWARSTGKQNYRAIAADKAWLRAVPLREAAPPDLAATDTHVTLAAERYAYPTGVAATLTAEISGPFPTPADLLAVVAALAQSAVITLAGAPAPQRMAAVLPGLLDGAETARNGKVDADGTGALQPVTLATVTATTGWPADPLVQGDAGHRLLESLCRLKAMPLTGQVGDLAKLVAEEAGSNPGTVRASVGRGRAIWSPEKSNDPDGARRLGCYHANQTLVAVQLGVLLDTITWASKLPAASLPQGVRDVLRPVVTLLGLIYGKVDDMYRSAFARAHIDDSGLVPAINTLRAALGVGSDLH